MTEHLPKISRDEAVSFDLWCDIAEYAQQKAELLHPQADALTAEVEPMAAGLAPVDEPLAAEPATHERAGTGGVAQ